MLLSVFMLTVDASERTVVAIDGGGGGGSCGLRCSRIKSRHLKPRNDECILQSLHESLTTCENIFGGHVGLFSNL